MKKIIVLTLLMLSSLSFSLGLIDFHVGAGLGFENLGRKNNKWEDLARYNVFAGVGYNLSPMMAVGLEVHFGMKFISDRERTSTELLAINWWGHVYPWGARYVKTNEQVMNMGLSFRPYFKLKFLGFMHLNFFVGIGMNWINVKEEVSTRLNPFGAWEEQSTQNYLAIGPNGNEIDVDFNFGVRLDVFFIFIEYTGHVSFEKQSPAAQLYRPFNRIAIGGVYNL